MPEGMKRIAVFLVAALVATPAMAHEAVRLSAEKGIDLIALGRRADDLAAMQADLEPRARWMSHIAALKPLAEAGNVDAMVLLGSLYSLDLSSDVMTRADYDNGISWLKRAAAAGSAAAETRLGYIYSYGRKLHEPEGFEIPADMAEAIGWFEKAAAHGDVVAQTELAERLVKGEDVPKDYVRAYYLYGQAAQNRSEDAQKALSLLFPYGASVASYDAFHKRLVHHAKAGDADAQWRLGALSLDYSDSRSVRVARPWLKKSAAKGNAAGLYYLGLSYEYEQMSLGADMELVRQAADLGYAPAQQMAATEGMGWDTNDPDNDRKTQWLKASADHDCPLAQMSLASQYKLGQGVERDPVESVKWAILGMRLPMGDRNVAQVIRVAGLSEADGAEVRRRVEAWLASHAGTSCW